MVALTTCAPPLSVSVPTVNPPEIVNTLPSPMSVVWLLLVLPNCSDAIVISRLTKLLTLETATTFPGSKNFTLSPYSGANVGSQLFVVVQLFAPAPGPFQTSVVGL